LVDGHIDIVRLLLNDPNAEFNGMSNTALSYAAEFQPGIVKQLLDGGQGFLTNDLVFSLFQYAALKEDKDLVHFLFNHPRLESYKDIPGKVVVNLAGFGMLNRIKMMVEVGIQLDQETIRRSLIRVNKWNGLYHETSEWLEQQLNHA
jgi:hypothetical protein